jgi:hypothetical protein
MLPSPYTLSCSTRLTAITLTSTAPLPSSIIVMPAFERCGLFEVVEV